MKAIIEKLRQEWIVGEDYTPPLVGCTENEIELLMESQGVEWLPTLYIEFMKVFGRKSGGLRHGGDFTYPAVLDFKKEWCVMLPSENTFVFLTNHDTFALYFHVDVKVDNPQVYRIDEADDEPMLKIELYCSLLEFFTDWIHLDAQ